MEWQITFQLNLSFLAMYSNGFLKGIYSENHNLKVLKKLNQVLGVTGRENQWNIAYDNANHWHR